MAPRRRAHGAARRAIGCARGAQDPLGVARARARRRSSSDFASTSATSRSSCVSARRARAARVADRRGDRARGRAHGPRDRRLPQRELRQRAGADHRPVRDRRRARRTSSAVRSPGASSRICCSCSASRCSSAAREDRPPVARCSQLGLVVLAVAALPGPVGPGLARRPRPPHARARCRSPSRRPARRLRGVTTSQAAPPRGCTQSRTPTRPAVEPAHRARRLAVATAATAIVSEILVHSLEAFADVGRAVGVLRRAVIVAIVGNAAEHGGGDRDRPPRQDRARDARSRSRRARRSRCSSRPSSRCSRSPSARRCRSRSGRSSWRRWPAPPCSCWPSSGTRRAPGEGVLLLGAYALIVVAYGLSGNR